MQPAEDLVDRILTRDLKTLPIENIELINAYGGSTDKLLKKLNQEHGFHLTPPWSWTNNLNNIPAKQLASIENGDYQFYESSSPPQLAVRLDFRAQLEQKDYGLIEEYLNQKLRLAIGPLIILPEKEELNHTYPFVYAWRINSSNDLITSIHLVTALSEYRQQSRLYGDLYSQVY